MVEYDTPETRPASWLVPYFIVGSAVVAVALVGMLVFAPQRFFPDAIHDTLTTTIGAVAKTPALAASKLEAIHARALAEFARSGVSTRDVISGRALIEKRKFDPGYEATQTLSIPADAYERFAKFSNRINRLHDPDVSVPFPQSPVQGGFTRTFVLVIVLGMLVGGGLSTRRADTTRAPKGMHPIAVALYTLTYAAIVALALYYVHAYFDGVVLGIGALEAVLVAFLGTWLFQTRRSWTQSRFYRAAFVAYIAGLVIVAGVAVWALAQPVV